MKSMKKILAVILCAVLVFSLSPASFAQEKTEPVIVVSGMASFPLYDGESGEQVFAPSAKAIMSVVAFFRRLGVFCG